MMEPIIKVLVTEMQTKIEDDCLKVCQSYGFDVDKERLRQALTDAKAFYDEGYDAGRKSKKRRRGQWVDGDCSECGYPRPTDDRVDYISEEDCRFCYHCGADMRPRLTAGQREACWEHSYKDCDECGQCFPEEREED